MPPSACKNRAAEEAEPEDGAEPAQSRTHTKKVKTPSLAVATRPKLCNALGDEDALEACVRKDVCRLECCPQEYRLLHQFPQQSC